MLATKANGLSFCVRAKTWKMFFRKRVEEPDVVFRFDDAIQTWHANTAVEKNLTPIFSCLFMSIDLYLNFPKLYIDPPAEKYGVYI